MHRTTQPTVKVVRVDSVDASLHESSLVRWSHDLREVGAASPTTCERPSITIQNSQQTVATNGQHDLRAVATAVRGANEGLQRRCGTAVVVDPARRRRRRERLYGKSISSTWGGWCPARRTEQEDIELREIEARRRDAGPVGEVRRCKGARRPRLHWAGPKGGRPGAGRLAGAAGQEREAHR